MSRRRILLFFLVFLTILVGGGYLVLHQTDAVRSFVRRVIGDTIHENLFRMDDARIDLTAGTVTVTRFELENPGLDTSGSPLLSVDKIQVEVETNPLGEVGAVRHVTLDGLSMNLSLAEGELPELSRILKVAGVDASKESTVLPSIRAVNSTVHLRVAPDRPVVTFSKVTIDVTPTESDPDELVLEGTMVSPLGHVITMRGDGSARNRRFRTLLTMHDVPIKPEQAAAFQAEAAEFLDTAKVTGLVKQATLWLDLSSETAAGSTTPTPLFQAGLNAEFENLSAAPLLFPYQIHGASGRLHASLANRGAVKFRLEHTAVDGKLAATGKITHCLTDTPIVDLQIDIADLLVGPRLRAAFQQSPIEFANQVDRAFAPNGGRVSAKVSIDNGDGTAGLGVTGKVELDGVGATFHGFKTGSGTLIGFPYPLHDAAGVIALERGAVILDGITAKDQDGAQIRLAGEIHLDEQTTRPNFDITGRDIRFSPKIRECLDVLVDGGAAIYDEYAPAGQADLSVRLRDAGRGLRYTVDISPRSANAAYQGFPVRIHGLQGLVKITNDGVWIDLRGNNGTAPVSIDGRFRFDDDGGSAGVRSELWVKATNLPVNDELRHAVGICAADLAPVWDQARPSGAVGCEFTLWKESQAQEFSYDLHLQVAGALQPRDLPVTIRDLRGDVFVHGTGDRFRCDISPLRGEADNGAGEPTAKITAQGAVHHGRDGLSADVTTIVRRLRIGHYRSLIGERKLVPAATWDALKVDGLVDVIANHRKAADRDRIQQDIRIRLRNLRSQSDALPGTAHDFHGEISITDDGASFDRIEGRIDRTQVTLREGRLDLRGAVPTLRFLVDSESIPVDHRLSCFMSGPVSQAFEQSKMRGRVGLQGFEIRAELAAEPVLRVHGKVRAHDLFMDVGLPGGHSVEHLTGTATVTGTSSAAGGRLTGTVESVGFELSNQRISATATRFDLDPQRLLLHDLRFNVAGGLVEGNGKDGLALRYDFAGDGVLRTYLKYQQVSLNTLLRDRGLAHSKVRGLLAGTIAIEELVGNNLVDMRATGEVVVSNGRLGRVPIFAALYSHIAEDKRPQFTQGRAKIAIDKRQIRLTEIRARSKEFRIEGEGTIAMDGYMDVRLNLPGVFGRAADILILPPLIDWTVSQVVRFQLYGYIRDPKLSWTFNKEVGRTALVPIGPTPADPLPQNPAGTK